MARAHGLTPLILGDALEGEARQTASCSPVSPRVSLPQRTAAPPAVLLAGGETTVTLGPGPDEHAGRTPIPARASPRRCHGAPAGDLGGGRRHRRGGRQADVAGALLTPNSLARARAPGLDPRAMLAGHDSYSLFKAAGDLIDTGPTFTNVNDIRAILIV